MFSLSTYLTFLAASIVLILMPGPAQALVLARTLGAGRRAGALTAVGLNVGTLFHAAAAALGLSAVLASSAVAFAVVKYVGAAYLIYLGIQAFRSRSHVPSAASAASSMRSSFSQGVATGVLNPKVALFFLAYLPQFVDPSRGSVFAQFMILGASMAILDTLYEVFLVMVTARLRTRFFANRRLVAWQNRITGAVLLALGLRLALQEQ
jgi:threonine/homoserine/homoserine lactone efflux protein